MLQTSFKRGSLVFLAALILCGCGKEIKLHPVTGKVLYPNGQPVTGVVVEFASIDQQPTINARAKIKPDGTFRLGTYQMEDGVVAGRHRAIVMPQMRDEKDTLPPPPPIDRRYMHYERSGLEYVVEPGGSEVVIQLTAPSR